MSNTNEILKEAMALRPVEKAKLVDQLIAILNEPDKDIDKLWAEEAEDRIDAYDRGEIKAVSLKEVLSKYTSQIEIGVLTIFLFYRYRQEKDE